MSSAALRACGILRALTDDHPQSLRGSPRQRGGKRWHDPYAAALRDVPCTAVRRECAHGRMPGKSLHRAQLALFMMRTCRLQGELDS